MNALISFVILAAVVYFLVVMPYTKAKERYFPSPEPGTPEDILLLAGDPRPARRRQQGALTLTRQKLSDGSAVVRAGPARAATSSPRVASRRARGRARRRPARRCVVSGSTSPNTAASRLRRSQSVSLRSCAEPEVWRLVARTARRIAAVGLRPPRCAAVGRTRTASRTGDSLPDPEGCSEPGGSAALIASLVRPLGQRLVGGDLAPTARRPRAARRPDRGTPGAGRTPRAR